MSKNFEKNAEKQLQKIVFSKKIVELGKIDSVEELFRVSHFTENIRNISKMTFIGSSNIPEKMKPKFQLFFRE